MVTSFDITGDGAATQNRFVLPRSHTHNMHTAGANGKSQMVNLSPAEIAADMQASATALEGIGVSAAGAHEIMASPFGDYHDRSKEGVREPGSRWRARSSSATSRSAATSSPPLHPHQLRHGGPRREEAHRMTRSARAGAHDNRGA